MTVDEALTPCAQCGIRLSCHALGPDDEWSPESLIVAGMKLPEQVPVVAIEGKHPLVCGEVQMAERRCQTRATCHREWHLRIHIPQFDLAHWGISKSCTTPDLIRVSGSRGHPWFDRRVLGLDGEIAAILRR